MIASNWGVFLFTSCCLSALLMHKSISVSWKDIECYNLNSEKPRKQKKSGTAQSAFQSSLCIILRWRNLIISTGLCYILESSKKSILFLEKSKSLQIYLEFLIHEIAVTWEIKIFIFPEREKKYEENLFAVWNGVSFI